MPRKKSEWSQAKLDKYIKEGRGEGSGKSYIPWKKIQDFSSSGRSSRISGWKTNRVHHFFSDLEKRMFFLLDCSDIVTDIREHYPLQDLELAMNIADQMGIKYPVNYSSKIPYILSTDFMITIDTDDGIINVARTIVSSSNLAKKRKVEILELERRYYQYLGIDWAIVTEKGIPNLLARNIEWIHASHDLDSFASLGNYSQQEINIIKTKLKEQLVPNDTTISKVISSLDEEMNLEDGTSLSIFKHLLARKEILCDMTSTKISTKLSTQLIQVREISLNSHE